MSVVKIEPEKRRVPFNLDEEKPATFADELAVAANTAETLLELGAPVEADEADAQRANELLRAAINNRKVNNLTDLNTAFAAAGFLRTYGQKLAFDIAQARAAITFKLMEIANCGDIKYELKALELLGKHSDIGLFTERSEITINYKNPEDLENAIKQRVKRLLNADIVDLIPISKDLDAEFGVFKGSLSPEQKKDATADELMEEFNKTKVDFEGPKSKVDPLMEEFDQIEVNFEPPEEDDPWDTD